MSIKIEKTENNNELKLEFTFVYILGYLCSSFSLICVYL